MLECMRVLLETFSLIDEEIDLLATLDDLFYVALHELLHLFHLLVGLSELVSIRIAGEELHLSLKNMAELGVHGHGKGGLASAAVGCSKTLPDIFQESKGQTPAESLLSHAHVCNSITADVMEDVLVIDIAHLAILLRDFVENTSGNLREIASAIAVFGEDNRASRNNRIDDRHDNLTI